MLVDCPVTKMTLKKVILSHLRSISEDVIFYFMKNMLNDKGNNDSSRNNILKISSPLFRLNETIIHYD